MCLVVILMAALCLAYPVCAVGAGVPIVEKGAAKVCIVVPDGAPKCCAASAAEFARWTKELTGVQLAVVSAAVPGLTPMTFTLDPNDGRVKYDGFRLTAAKDAISIVAKEPFGIVHSSYWMLNRFSRIWWCDPECEPDFAKTDSFMLGCDTDGIRVYAGIIELTYHVTTPTCPIIRYSTELTVDAEWVALNNSAGEPNPDVPDITVQWENNPPPGTMIAYISLPNRPSGFFTASIESVGGAKFFTNMEADLQGGITCTNTSLNTTGVIYPTFDGTSVQWNWRMR